MALIAPQQDSSATSYLPRYILVDNVLIDQALGNSSHYITLILLLVRCQSVCLRISLGGRRKMTANESISTTFSIKKFYLVVHACLIYTHGYIQFLIVLFQPYN